MSKNILLLIRTLRETITRYLCFPVSLNKWLTKLEISKRGLVQMVKRVLSQGEMINRDTLAKKFN
ncbi:MAG: hypothetical protein CM15mP29_3680 [Alphaproteobacteria bacterium]|nr:MAG: hypothetical protein CM15mP29_3680 [Alphaproteobacteria bacterium]